ncbi:uncharacterized protein LOC122718495 [Apis laboriosa]|uniref:uncharacterized protein LOC122718495 n=1 Tax=Apis laboriosa TaxID=183418 RepID=UPI001CC5211C|nr:uncharacterized protein LOC122718495 [Apis laboriosa]
MQKTQRKVTAIYAPELCEDRYHHHVSRILLETNNEKEVAEWIKRKNVTRNQTITRCLGAPHLTIHAEMPDILNIYQDVCTPGLIHIKKGAAEKKRSRENSNKDAWELVRCATRHTGARLDA